jgi:hypothetical protein
MFIGYIATSFAKLVGSLWPASSHGFTCSFVQKCTDEATGASFLVALAVSISGCGETKSSDPTEPEHELQKSARERDEAEGEGGPGQVNR